MINQTTNLFSQLANQYLKGEIEQDIITDPDIQKIVHGLQKKSETTKSKTLSELKTFLPNKSNDFFDQFTPTFINIYRRYVDNEYERRVLELSNQVLGLISEFGKKSLSKKFKQLFPQWFIMMNDYNTEISQTALNAFSIAFPTKEKQTQAIKMCSDQYLNDLKHYLTLTVATIKQESNLEDEKVDHIYERLKISSINSIRTAITWNPDPEFIESIMNLLHFEQKNTIIIEQLNSQKPRFVAAIIETLHFLLCNETAAPFVLLKSEALLKKTVQLFEEKDRLIVSALWRGFTTKLFQKAPQEQLQKLSTLEAKQLEVISKAGFGVGKLLYDQLVVFVSLNPVYSMTNVTKEEMFKQKLASINKLLQSILIGIKHEESRFFSDNLINSYFEVLYFVICKRMIPMVQKFPCFGQIKNIVIASIRAVLQNALSQQGVQAYNHNPYKQVPQSLLQFFNILKVNESQDQLLELIKLIIADMKTLQLNEYQVFVNIIQSLLKVNNGSPAYTLIQNYIKEIFDEIYNNNDILKGSQLLEIMPDEESFKRADCSQKIQQIVQNLFSSVDLISQQELLTQCQQVKTYIYNLQRINKESIIDLQLKKIIDSQYKQLIPKEEQQSFKLKWICLHILADTHTDATYYAKYLTMKDSIQEYNLIEKHLKKSPQKSLIMQQLIEKSLQITNLSQRIFIPSIIANCNELITQQLKQKQQEIAQQVIKALDKNFLNIFEEISFILDKVEPQESIFDVLLQFYIRNQSQKVQFLMKMINSNYQQLFVQFFQKQINKIGIDTLQQYCHFFRDVFAKIDSQVLLQYLQFNLASPVMWKIFSLIDLPNNYFTQLYQAGELEKIAIFLASNYSSIMMYDHKLKRFIQNVICNSIKPIILDAYELEDEKSLNLIKILFNSQDIVYGVALRHLIKQITLEEIENNHRSNQTEKLSQLVVDQLQQSINEENIDKIITIRQIINIADLGKKFTGTLEKFVQTKKILYLDIYTLVLRQQKDLLELEDEQKLDQIIALLFEQTLDSNYEKMVAFDFINLICERKTITPFAAFIKQIADLFKKLFQTNVQLKRYYSFSIVAALQFVRKILNFIEAFPVEFIDYLNFELTDSLLQIISFCENPKPEFMDEQNDTLFIEYAETLLRCIQLEQWAEIDVGIYNQLLQCPFISIQKAAFIALKNQNDHSGLSAVLDGFDMKQEEMRRLKQEEEDIEDVISFPLDGKILTNLLAWLVVLQNKNCVQFKEKFPIYLNNLLYILQFLNDNGVVPRFNFKEIYQQDLDLMTIQDDQSELFKMIVISFYQFIIAQQSYFKQWYNQECNNTQKKQLEDLLLVISKAIYTREVELIELKQEEWRSDGFDIYIAKNQQEITATYQKEEQKIEILIQVPVGFPLKPLKVETKKGVKISEDKLKKWSLMIRMILQNDNDTILTALKLWKKNIDEQFSGLEECAICYYIIHQNGELPKMACRTCKHKFHSTCIQKWFHSSNKSDCPLCKSQFL